MSCCGNNKFGCAFDADQEGPSEADIARFGADDIPCPDCGTAVYHDAPLCQNCGHAMTEDDVQSQAGLSGRSVLIGGIAIVTAVAFILMSI